MHCWWVWEWMRVLQYSNQMRSTRKLPKEKSSEHSDTCESLPRAVPSKVLQTEIKHNYRNLAQIPIVPNCRQIRRLYLSHNCIASVEGIQNYHALTSLNVSYNCLTRISELKLIANPLQIDKISLRMNHFQFGYQDYAVTLLPNLKKLEGEALMDATGKHSLRQMKELVRKEFLEFYKKTQLIVEQITWHQNKENRNINGKNTQKTVKNIQYIHHEFFNKLKDLYFYPKEEELRQKNTQFLLNLCQSYIKLLTNTQIYTCSRQKRREEDYLRQTKDAFGEVCSTILLKYSSRNDKTLKNYLQSITPQNESIINAFSKLGNYDYESQIIKKQQIFGDGVRVPSLATNPSKYLRRIDNIQLKNHPMNRMVNWKQPQYKTLIPLEQTKWNDFYQNLSTADSMECLFEEIPIFIYCKEYLEVITEIMLDQVSKILSVQHIMNTQSEGSQEIQFNLSSSAMSFGQKGQDQFQDSLDEQNQIEKQTNSFKQPIKQNVQEQLKTLPKFNKRQLEQSFALNIDRYTIYQINLIFKSFRSLKMQIKKQLSQ